MKEIRLLNLYVSNFKGIKEINCLFNGKNYNIYGDNATGKTSVKDAFTWLLFGKDSLGRADFGIKPLSESGAEIHNLETTVEAVFMIGETERTFKKVLREVWTRKRGAAEAEFTRNENDFYIDGVPKKKMEYTAEIKEIIDEEVFKIITDPFYFNESVAWKDRRSTLLDICGDITDEDVIASKPDLQPLLGLLQGRTVADFKEIAVSKMRQINKELEVIPAKINEAELAKPSQSQLEVDNERKNSLEAEIESLRIRKSEIQNGSAVVEEKSRIERLRIEYNTVGHDFVLLSTPEYRAITSIKMKQTELQAKKSMLSSQIESMDYYINKHQDERSKLSAEWDKVSSEQFTDNVCPTCKRELPEDEVEAKRKEFNRIKVQKLDSIESNNESLLNQVQKYTSEKESLKKELEEVNQTLEGLESELKEANEGLEALKQEMAKKHEAERARIQEEINQAEAQIKEYESGNVSVIQEIEEQINTLSKELSGINEAIANKALLERQEKRIEELRNQQNLLSEEYNTADRHNFLCEQFVVTKVSMLNDRINQKFKYAKFKLFEKQLNGGINEVCEVTYKGIPYKDLNNAMRVNVGLDVINSISAHYGVSAPILIDNCESVNELLYTKAQQIRMYVSKSKQLLLVSEDED